MRAPLLALAIALFAVCASSAGCTGSSGSGAASAPATGSGHASRSGPAHSSRCAATQRVSAGMAKVAARPTGLRVDVLGDSYSVGAGLAHPATQTWDVLLAHEEGWSLTIHGIGGTGFVNGGACGNDQYQARLPAVLADKPELIIVEGGLNDVRSTGVAQGAHKLLAAIPTSIKVVVVGPTLAPARSAALERRVDATLAAVTKQFPGRVYVSTIGWKLQFNSGGLHLSAVGHQTYAKDLAAAIHKAGI